MKTCKDIVSVVTGYTESNKRFPAQVRVSNLNLRRILAEVGRDPGPQHAVFQVQILDLTESHAIRDMVIALGGEDMKAQAALLTIPVITDWDMDDATIAADVYTWGHGPRGLQLSDVCSSLVKWAHEFGTELPTDSEYKKKEREEFLRAWDKVYIAIQKSNLLWRMFYSGDGVRTVPCPVHKGKWSGYYLNSVSAPNPIECATEEFPYGCLSGYDITGWLPNSEMGGHQRAYYAANKPKED